MNFVQTDVLKIAFEDSGPSPGEPVILLHGWPDSPVSWFTVAKAMNDFGYRTIAPYLRGSFPSEFISSDTPRDAAAVAMAQDVIDLANCLSIGRFFVAGHDWGARVAYTLAALFPDRVRAIVTLALGYQPRGEFHLSTFHQSRHFWYQFFQCTPAGARAVRNDPVGFARIQWDTWGPKGWFTQNDFDTASKHFTHPDWAEITLNAYRSRYLAGETLDLTYAPLQAKLRQIDTIGVPTVMIQGAADTCDLAMTSEGRGRFFTGGYERLLLKDVGHFPHREAPEVVTKQINKMLIY